MNSRIQPGQAAHLELPGSGGFAARIEERTDAAIHLSALLDLPVPARQLPGTQIDLSVATPRGVVQARAEVLEADDDGRLVVRPVAEPTVDQRHEHFRLSALVPSVVAPADGSHPPLHTSTLDVSAGGALVMGAGPVAPGTELTLTLRVPELGPLELRGVVRRRTDSGHVAVAFDGLGDQQREALVRWIFERQRLARQAGVEGR